MAEIQARVIKRSGRKAASRFFHAKNDKEAIVAWKSDLNRILLVFNVRSVAFALASLFTTFQTELVVNTHVTVSGMRHDLSKIVQGEVGVQVGSVSASRIGPIGNMRILTIA